MHYSSFKQNLKVQAASCIMASTLALAACSSQVNFERYSLTQQCSALAQSNPNDIILTLSPALTTGGIIMQTGPNTLVSAKEHRWAQPLESELTALFNQGLINAAAEAAIASGSDVPSAAQSSSTLAKALKGKSLEVYVTAFQGNLLGEGTVTFLTTLKNKDGSIYKRNEYSKTAMLEDDGYAELCRVLQQSFMDLTKEFAAENLEL